MRQASQVVHINAKIRWAFSQDAASGQWIGVCPPLNLNALGDTYQEALSMANEATILLFEDLLEESELDGYLERQGWTKVVRGEPTTRPVAFDIPFGVDLGSEAQELVGAH